MIMSGHPFIKALAAYWGGASVQGLRCHFISMPGKSPMKLEVTSRHDHSCLLGRKASKQTNKQNCSTSSTRHVHDIHGEISVGSCDPLRVNTTLVGVLRYVYENNTTFL